MSDTTIATSLAEAARTSIAPSLRPGEEFITAGGTMNQAPWWLLFFRSAAETASIRVTILTSQRLLLTQTKSWIGKWTPDTIIVKRNIELTEITKAEARGNVLHIRTTQGDLKLVGYKAFGLLATPPGFLTNVLVYINSHNRPAKP